MVEWGDAEPHREATSPSATVRTLLVEGDALQRTAVKAMCAKRGHVVMAVSDAAEALQALDARRFDLVLTSSNDGVGLVRKLRSVEGRRLCCAVMSSDDALEEASSEAGADLFVRKPLRVADIPRLEEAVQRRRRERDALLVERTSGDMEASAVRLQRARRGSLGRAEAARLRAGIQEQIAARSRIPGHLHNALFELGRGTGGGDCLKLAAAGEVQRSSSEEAPRRASGKRWSVFISHYKAEAAMEARWLQGELQERLGGKAFSHLSIHTCLAGAARWQGLPRQRRPARPARAARVCPRLRGVGCAAERVGAATAVRAARALYGGPGKGAHRRRRAHRRRGGLRL
mmetsp:Transcript_7673/g.22378  ORF Transcript_7673/g.22378 Transcript_7673/m.22378 type:complete len:345 (+) Transcript_7673:46-1080(+)